MQKFLLFFLAGSLLLIESKAQSVFAPLNADYNHLVERYEIRYGKFADRIHTHMKPYLRKSIVQLADSVEKKVDDLNERDKFNLDYLRNDSWEWSQSPDKQGESDKPLWNTFYKKKSDTYYFRNDDFEIHASPVLHVGFGKDQDSDKMTFVNTRGLEIRGMIAKKLGFYTYFADNQGRFADYVAAWTNRSSAEAFLPGEGLTKTFKGDNKTYDFLSARGYISFQAVKFINIQFGHDKNFIGNGLRSMILSDFSSPYLFLKLTTQIGRFQYMNLFSEIYDRQQVLPYGQLPPKKFFVFHHLSLNVTNNLNIGVFETEIFGRAKDQGYFDLSYMNPIIFYRAIEQQKGSPDNAMVGFDFKANMRKRFSIYGQVLLDEFVLSALKAGDGSWVNKFGVQLGGKYINAFGIDNLDLQGEVNLARPYTYQHLSDQTNYINYNQPLAHPLGANFKEFVGIARFQPTKRLFLTGTMVLSTYGTDSTPTENWGGSPLKNYDTRKQDLGNSIGQGVKNNLTYLDFTASYMLKHNFFVDLKAIARKVDSADNTLDRNTVYVSGALRWNIGQRQFIF
ncbi:MAG: hypothetical protein U0Y10_27480 [Spirosomataceae bacterium]